MLFRSLGVEGRVKGCEADVAREDPAKDRPIRGVRGLVYLDSTVRVVAIAAGRRSWWRAREGLVVVRVIEWEWLAGPARLLGLDLFEFSLFESGLKKDAEVGRCRGEDVAVAS